MTKSYDVSPKWSPIIYLDCELMGYAMHAMNAIVIFITKQNERKNEAGTALAINLTTDRTGVFKIRILPLNLSKVEKKKFPDFI